MISKKYLHIVSALSAFLLLGAYMLQGGGDSNIFSVIQIIFGSIFILFIPGYYCINSFFSDSEIDELERFALSFALSISIVPLISFYLNLLGVPIHFYSIFCIVLGIIAINIFYQLFHKKHLGTNK